MFDSSLVCRDEVKVTALVPTGPVMSSAFTTQLCLTLSHGLLFQRNLLKNITFPLP